MEVGIKTRDEILEELNEYGFSVIENYWDRETCETAIDELNSLPTHLFEEGQGGDLRCTRSNDHSSAARSFMEDRFIQEIADMYSSCNEPDRTVAGIVRYDSKKPPTLVGVGMWIVSRIISLRVLFISLMSDLIMVRLLWHKALGIL